MAKHERDGTGKAASVREISLLTVGVKWPMETFLARLIDGLLAAGLDVTVACDKRPSKEWRVRPNFHWLHAPSWQGTGVTRLARLAGMLGPVLLRAPRDLGWIAAHASRADHHAKWVQTWYRSLPFAGKRWDVLYFPWNSSAITYFSLFDLKIPVVISCLGSQIHVAPHNPDRVVLTEGLKLTFERAAAVHCVSEAIRDEAARYGLDPQRARVIRAAVDPNFFRPDDSSERSEHPFHVVTTGSLLWVKGHEYALSSIRKLVDRGVPVRFSIIGDGPERQRLLYTIHDLYLEDHVCLLGRLRPEAVREQLQRADAFVLSSLSEGISNAVLEAMACGLPVVTTDCGGMREAVTDEVEGYVVPVRDADAMADALECLAGSPRQRRAMGAAGRQRVLQEFALDQQIVHYIDLFARAKRLAG